MWILLVWFARDPYTTVQLSAGRYETEMLCIAEVAKINQGNASDPWIARRLAGRDFRWRCTKS